MEQQHRRARAQLAVAEGGPVVQLQRLLAVPGQLQQRPAGARVAAADRPRGLGLLMPVTRVMSSNEVARYPLVQKRSSAAPSTTSGSKPRGRAMEESELARMQSHGTAATHGDDH